MDKIDSLFSRKYDIKHLENTKIRKEGNFKMKNLLQKWNSLSLIVRILIGLIIGAILGIAAPKATGLVLLEIYSLVPFVLWPQFLYLYLLLLL